jgi:long-chain acyl-CoA synthetase
VTSDRDSLPIPATLADCVRSQPAGRPAVGGWTAGELTAGVAELARALLAAGVGNGEAIGLPLPNGEQWVRAFLALLVVRARPLPMTPETPAAERDRLLALAAGGRWLEAAGDPGNITLGGTPGQPGGPPGVLLPTSGTTGQPTLVLRSEASWLAEGERYRAALGLDGGGRLLVPAPLSHAYALGWLAAALLTGTHLCAVQPTALNAIARELADGATMLVLVPSLARLLVARELRRGTPSPAPALRIPMVGAGPVDDALETSFRKAFGVGTGRNYGSTETGALFCAEPGLPPLCVGQPMPGVEYRILDDSGLPCPPGTQGSLHVRVHPDDAWRDMKDLAVTEPAGIRILGRRATAIRRAGQWIAPLEVESVLREHPGVRDAHVWSRRGRFEDEDVLVADVEAADPRQLRDSDLAAFARERLIPAKVPQEIRIQRQLARTPSGKVKIARRYRLAAPDALLAAARAYKVSELLFALADLGALPLLACGCDASELAARLGLQPAEADWMLAMASGLGLARAEDDSPPPGGASQAAGGDSVDIMPFIELEALLSRTWTIRSELASAVRLGMGRRPFEAASLDQALVAAYSRAMHDRAAQQRTGLALRLTRQLSRRRVVEVTAGPGRYLSRLLADDPATTGCLVQLGRLAGPPAEAVGVAVTAGRADITGSPPAGEFDLCVVANGIHGPHPGDDLAWLLAMPRRGGAILIDDVFLPDEGGQGAELGLDWLTHGGIAWPHARELCASLASAGWEVTLNRRLGSSHCHLILATEG